MMTKWGSIIRAKIRSRRGESITEVLVAIVVSGLAILMLATVIATAVNVNRASQQSMNEYYAANNSVVSGGVTASGSVSLESGVAIADRDSVTVTYHIGEQADGTLVISYAETDGSGATG